MRRGRWRRACARLPFLAFLAAAALAIAAPGALSPRQQAEDLDVLWRAVDSGYAYFDPGTRAAWKRARDTWRPRAMRAGSRSDFVATLEGALAELRDDHIDLSEHSARFGRRVPFETDIWAAWRDGAAVIEALRTFSDADVAGLKPGQAITALDGVALERALGNRLGRSANARGFDWALRQLLAGPRLGIQRVEVRDGPRKRTLDIERTEARNGHGAPPVLGRRVGDERDIGYLRVRVGAADPRLAEHFDAALNYLQDTRALILDLRESAGPGSRDVTKAILGRFVASEKPWQQREMRNGARVVDTVAPRGDAYRAPVLVLVDRWTAGEGEALAAGMAAVAHARWVGTPTAGLRGELREVRLPHSAIAVTFPAEKSLSLDGVPRESLRPAIAVDLAAPSGGPGDPILYQALKALAK